MEKSIKAKFDSYPDAVKSQLEYLRSLIFQVAADLALTDVDKSLKWEEPSYHVKHGSPIRIDWKQRSPDNYYLFFNCQTRLIDTFRELYSDILDFQGNRAIVLNLHQPIPEHAIKHCIELALTYKNRKHLPLLGA
jgi:hypothetical protein